MRRLFAPLLAVCVVALAAATSAEAAGNHMCREGDPPILASAHTSCGLAGNYLDSWYNSPWAGPIRTMAVRSPVTHRWYLIYGRERNGYVTATGPNGIWFQFVSE